MARQEGQFILPPPRLTVPQATTAFETANLIRALIEYVRAMFRVLETEGALDALSPDIEEVQDNLDSHAALTNNPHEVIASQVTFTPGGTVGAAEVQAAILEVAIEALQLTGGTMTGTIIFEVTQLFDGRDLSVDGAKLDGVEAGATADQNDAEIKVAYENNANTNEFSDAEQTKLAGIETAADVTDTANVTAAGALIVYEVVVDQGDLAGAGTVVLVDSSAAQQYKVREIFLSGDGTNFSGGGGDRLLDIKEGTTVWSTIPAATLQALAVGRWGDAGVPYPATAADFTTASSAGADIVAQYSGGSADYSAGSLTFVVKAERVA